MFVAVLAAAATFWGWRGIGRTMTLFPVEIAKALNAPLMSGGEALAIESEILKRLDS